MVAARLPNWLGDLCLAMRAVDALVGRAGPEAVVLVARPWARALWSAHWPGVRWLDAPAPGGRWLPSVLPLARVGAGTIVLFPPSLSARLHAFAAGVPSRVGLADEPGGFLLTKSAPRGRRGTRHLEDEYLDLVRVVGAVPQARRTLVLAAEADERARAVEERTGLAARPPGARLIVAPGARYGPAKRWPAERFAEAARLWALAQPAPEAATVLLAGGEEDRAQTAAVRAASPTGPHATLDLAGTTDLAALAGLLARADAVLSNDSGVAHLAAALGRPTAVVFGSTDPRWTAPRGTAVSVVSHPPACAPCFLRTCAIADLYRCMRAVEPGEVAARLVTPAAGPAAGPAGGPATGPAAGLAAGPAREPAIAPSAAAGLRRPRLSRRAVFLDRDGTLMPELGYLGDPSRVRLLPGVGAALRILDRAGYALVVVTNQSAIGRGAVTAGAVDRVHTRLRDLVRAEQAELAGIYLCPHRPDEDCACRKPRSGLLERAIEELDLRREDSWMVGDGAKDVAAGRAAGVRPLLVLTGWGASERGAALAAGLPPADVVPDLLAAAERIVGGDGIS